MIKIDTVFVKQRADGDFEFTAFTRFRPRGRDAKRGPAGGWSFKMEQNDLPREDWNAIKQLLETPPPTYDPSERPIKPLKSRDWIQRDPDGRWDFGEF